MDTKHTACYALLFTIIFCICLAATACPPPPPPTPNYITVCGDITTNTTWTSDKTYYVSCIIYIRNNATLTIEPGTVVKFNAATGISAFPYGKLIAEGTPDSYITFTSKYDCNVGERVDSSRQPQKADWGGLRVKKDSKISFCNISYGYDSVNISDAASDITSFSIEHNIIRMCNTGIFIFSVTGTNVTLNIFNNLVANCDQGGIWYQSSNEWVHLNIFNNTVVDCANIGLYVHNESDPVYVYNNLISGCNIGIQGGGWADPHCSYNAFYGTATEFMYVDEVRQGTTTNVHPAVSPFGTCVLGTYFLNDTSNGGGLLINGGNPSSPDMLGYTSQCLKLSDEAPVDIGFHYPSDYEGKGRDIICGITLFPSDSVISAGGDHSLFRKGDTNKTVWACGYNDDGAAGLGEAKKIIYTYSPEQVLEGNKYYPVDDAYLDGIVSVDAGDSHSLAVGSEGFVWTWGNNDQGQLGTGDIITRWEPVRGLSNIKKVCAGSGSIQYSLALDGYGKVWSWGRNSYSLWDVVYIPPCADTGFLYGLLGTDSTADYVTTPSRVLNIIDIVDIDHSGTHSIVCDKNGNVWTWGYNGHGELGNGVDEGCCGSGKCNMHSTVPVKVLGGEMGTPFLENIVDVAVSGYGDPIDWWALGLGADNASYALDSNGHVWSWGYGKYGQLGDNNESRWFEEGCNENWRSSVPIKVRGGEMGTRYLDNIVAISAGSEHVLALDKFGSVWAWGVNKRGQVGNGGVGDCVYYDGCCYPFCDYCFPVTDIEGGGVMAPDRVLKCHYDENAYPDRLVGDGPLTDIVAIEAGGEHSIAIDKAGKVWVWGNNINGQLGLGLGDTIYSGYSKAIQMTTWEFCP